VRMFFDCLIFITSIFVLYGDYCHLHGLIFSLEFHGEFVFVDADLFNQPPDKLLVVFSEGGRFHYQCYHSRLGVGVNGLEAERLTFQIAQYAPL
ncbi:MAG: hypothetical protein PHG06_11390, partial [Parabacteroides sp.]|nr:hypothetical protein [Parabacteroides sp.]